MITNEDKDADEDEYISLLIKARMRINMSMRAIKIYSKLDPLLFPFA